jgi:polyvinyl alcohol dehydrogenase (cytochrome)
MPLQRTALFDSEIALNLQSGALEWGHKVQGYDAWTVARAVGEKPGATWWPSPSSPDFDFGGRSPNLIQIPNGGGHPQTYVGDGQKSGIYWVFNPNNGKIVWNTLVGAGTSLGGIEWGNAYDGDQLYVPISDFFGPQYGLEGDPNNQITGGSWAALNRATGGFKWQTPTPDGTPALGPVSVANGVMNGESMNPGNGANMFALNSATGQILWQYNSGASVIGGGVDRQRDRVLGLRVHAPRPVPSLHRQQQALRVHVERQLKRPDVCPRPRSGRGHTQPRPEARGQRDPHRPAEGGGQLLGRR